MTTISYYCDYIHNEDGWCNKDYISVSDEEMTASGFHPICQDYVEYIVREDGET